MGKYLDNTGLSYFWGKLKAYFVAKEAGKGLSANDYTTTEKTKLASIEDGAEKNIWIAVSSLEEFKTACADTSSSVKHLYCTDSFLVESNQTIDVYGTVYIHNRLAFIFAGDYSLTFADSESSYAYINMGDWQSELYIGSNNSITRNVSINIQGCEDGATFVIETNNIAVLRCNVTVSGLYEVDSLNYAISNLLFSSTLVGDVSQNTNLVMNKIPLPTASSSTLGGVKVGTGLTITDGVLSLLPKIVDVSASKTLALTDAGTMQDCSSASAIEVTIPLSSSVAFATGASIGINRLGAGAVTVKLTSGVTLNGGTADIAIKTQYKGAVLRKLATDTWLLQGDI